MHVVKQFSAAVLIDDLRRSLEWINEMPMPVMKVNADVLPEVANSVLHVQVVGSVVVGYFNGSLS